MNTIFLPDTYAAPHMDQGLWFLGILFTVLAVAVFLLVYKLQQRHSLSPRRYAGSTSSAEIASASISQVEIATLPAEEAPPIQRYVWYQEKTKKYIVYEISGEASMQTNDKYLRAFGSQEKATAWLDQINISHRYTSFPTSGRFTKGSSAAKLRAEQMEH